jgi:hypothetical protein
MGWEAKTSSLLPPVVHEPGDVMKTAAAEQGNGALAHA